MRRSRSNWGHGWKPGRKVRRRFRALAWIWALVIAALLLVPGRNLPGAGLPEAVVTALALGVHFVVFLALAYLAARGYSEDGGYGGGSGDGGSRRPEGCRSRVLAAVLAYCVLLEILQIAVPGRGFEFVDIAIGWLGALLGLGRRG